jgi:RimJ/RimL family protein N-acetyltransferase
VGLRWWPLFDLRILTPRLELRVSTDDDLDALADLAAAGIHGPDEMPFGGPSPWTEQEQPALQRGLLQWFWRKRAELSPDNWYLGFCVREGSVIVGMQGVFAEQFPVRRTVRTDSWLGKTHQGRGIGKEMRAAVLYLAFASFGAERAETDAFEDNTASLGVTRALGYEPNGESVLARQSEAARLLNFVLTREKWQQQQHRDDITVEGVEECLPLLGPEPA